MVALRKYAGELRQRAVGMVLHAQQNALTYVGACRRIDPGAASGTHVR